MATFCQNIGFKTFTPLFDCSVNDLLVKLTPLVQKALTKMLDIPDWCLVNTSDLVINWIEVRTVWWPECRSNEVWIVTFQQCNGTFRPTTTLRAVCW